MISKSHIKAQLKNVEQLGIMKVFREAAKKHSIPVTLLLAISSRETGMGTDPFLLANNWTGRDGHGKGIMQVDDRYHSIMTIVPADDHERNIDFAAQFLSGLLDELPTKRQAVAAYNAGAGAVRSAVRQGLNPDAITTGGDFSQDVLNREKMIAREMGVWGFRAGFIEAIPALLLLSGGTGFLIQQLKQQKN